MLKNPKLEKSLGPYIGKAGRAMEGKINANFSQAGHDITLDHWIILVHLWMQDGQNQKTLCTFAGRHKTMITRALNNLEKKNYVLRVPDTTDRRNKLIYLTHKGRDIQEELSTIMINTLEEATSGIDAAELETCKKVLLQVFLNLADEDSLRQFEEISNKRNHLK